MWRARNYFVSNRINITILLADHHAFTYRNDLLFISSGMVIISLVIAQVVLPFVTSSAPKAKIGSMNFKEARIYILEHVIDYLNHHSSFETSYRYGNVIKEYHDKLTFLKSVEKDDENSKELERLQSLAFKVETKTLERLADDGEITASVLENYMRYAERTQVYRQASLIRRMIVGARAVLICDGYLMRIDNLSPSNFFNTRAEDSITKIKLNALREQRRVLSSLTDDGEITESTALKLREAINYDEMVIVDSLTD